VSRIRTIKPQFFTDDIIAELPPLARLLFIGMWTLADREGRLEDRAKRIKVEILPYDDTDVDELLQILADRHFITRYTVDFHRYIQIRTFEKHQILNPRESPSVIPKNGTDDDAGKSRSARVRTRANLKKIRANLKSANTQGRDREGIGKGRVEREVEAPDAKLPDNTLSLVFSEEFFDDLQDQRVYSHLDVRHVFEKYKAWCKTRNLEPKPDKFVGWLNREIPNRKENGSGDDDDRGTSAQAKRVAASLERDN